MAYKIEQVTSNISVVKPGHWWGEMSSKDLINALKELSGVVVVVRFKDWFAAKYIVITRKEP